MLSFNIHVYLIYTINNKRNTFFYIFVPTSSYLFIKQATANENMNNADTKSLQLLPVEASYYPFLEVSRSVG